MILVADSVYVTTPRIMLWLAMIDYRLFAVCTPFSYYLFGG
jgi:hypothetical protein